MAHLFIISSSELIGGATMGKITVTMWLTLDGFAAGPNGELDWIMGDDEMSRYELNAVSSRDTLLFGANTYKDFSFYWPHTDSIETAMDWEKQHGRNMTERRKVVVSNSIENPEWKNSEVLSELTLQNIQKLKDESNKGILIYGSIGIVQQLINLNLVDRFELLVHPLALSKGKALFDKLDKPLKLNLIDTTKFQTGVQLQVYELSSSK